MTLMRRVLVAVCAAIRRLWRPELAVCVETERVRCPGRVRPPSNHHHCCCCCQGDANEPESKSCAGLAWIAPVSACSANRCGRLFSLCGREVGSCSLFSQTLVCAKHLCSTVTQVHHRTHSRTHKFTRTDNTVRTFGHDVHTKIRVHEAGIVGVQDQFAAKLQTRMHPISFRFVVAPYQCDTVLPL